MADFDLVIRNGTVIDGSGETRFEGDVAVLDGRIAAIGTVSGTGSEEIDARGRIVTPGFVDLHTHYDGQVTWEHRLGPSSNHGVTTVVGGNCGVGFAPCRPGDRDALLAVMEGVEDIPEAVMAQGVPWNWESYPEYLDAVAARAFDIDVGLQIPHSPIRVYVMGERGIRHEPSTPADREQMAQLVTEAIAAGALGVTTSRSQAHRDKHGEKAPSVDTEVEELLALARGLRAAGAGVFQLVPGYGIDRVAEFAVIEQIARTCERPLSFTVTEIPGYSEDWRYSLEQVGRLNAEGYAVRGQVAPRPVGFYMGLDLSLNPILTRPGYQRIAHLPLAERVRILRDPAVKQSILAEESIPHPQVLVNIADRKIASVAPLGDPPNYFPAEADQLGARAAREGTTPLSLAYDMMLEEEGHALLYLPAANFCTGTDGPVHEMITHEHAVVALGDGGAHYGFICDAPYTSFLLGYWARDVAPERRVSLEWAVHALARKPAMTIGLEDRGLISPGLKADLNIIDADRVQLCRPVVKWDLPGGGRRMTQPVDGIDATIVSGAVTYRGGEATGALPGRLVRGAGYRGVGARA